ncbi:Zn-ribbon domain-containing OB-fold protein [Marisediminicola senii]|uniref:Zn-ribbon domain-containing OB-fold protein n=1 Tax=Marisediminicola senii TaxID=2711233 RepID=UPI0013EAD962|nr:Zn-ribbon domain-containing OB-fold protein [Marisediminicola senii]
MTAQRPTPTPRGEEAVYFNHAANRELVFQRCSDCDRAVFYLRTLCPGCGSESLEVTVSSGLGTVYSFTTQYRAAHPFFAADVPYTLVLADMEEGFRLFANIVDRAPGDVHIGMPVETIFDPVTDELTLPRFRAATAGVPS